MIDACLCRPVEFEDAAEPGVVAQRAAESVSLSGGLGGPGRRLARQGSMLLPVKRDDTVHRLNPAERAVIDPKR